MIKPVGDSVLVKIEKTVSKIELLPGTQKMDKDASAVIVALGTISNLGVKIGHAVMFKHGTQPLLVESTDTHDLIIVSESQILYIKNYEEE